MFNKKRNDIIFRTKNCSQLTNEEIMMCSDLFSRNYGVYSANSPINPGQNIKLGPKYYKEHFVNNPKSYCSLAFYRNRIVGQAFYILLKTNTGYLSWITQLVVHKKFRNRGIARRLLISVWGFSGDRAWGLATSNPLTVKTLESATFRKVTFSTMQKNIAELHQIAKEVDFISNRKLDITSENAVVNTDFFVDHKYINQNIKKYGYKKWPYQKLEEGHEWLAFTFQGQPIKTFKRKELNYIFKHSENSLKDAYSRMDMQNQGWTKGTFLECDFIESFFFDKSKPIIDFGCGTGRHLLELERRGFSNLTGIDFSEKNIQKCKSCSSKINFNISDCRKYKKFHKYSYALCLYDVIGSFSNDKDNIKILKNLYYSLKFHGRAIISVMNMELTENVAKPSNIINIYENPQKLFKLKASNTMQKTGNIFNPDYYIIDTETKCVFRKEMFIKDGLIAAEYIVRDRRYSMEHISNIVRKIGFKILDSRYVRAGGWDNKLSSTDLNAKEILLVVSK